MNSVNWLSVQLNDGAELSLNRKNKESKILRFDFSTFENMIMQENSGRPFGNPAVRKQYSTGKISIKDLSAIRRDDRFTSPPTAMSPNQRYGRC